MLILQDQQLIKILEHSSFRTVLFIFFRLDERCYVEGVDGMVEN